MIILNLIGYGYEQDYESDILLLDISNNEEFNWTTHFDPSISPISPPISPPLTYVIYVFLLSVAVIIYIIYVLCQLWIFAGS